MSAHAAVPGSNTAPSARRAQPGGSDRLGPKSPFLMLCSNVSDTMVTPGFVCGCQLCIGRLAEAPNYSRGHTRSMLPPPLAYRSIYATRIGDGAGMEVIIR